MERSWLRMIVAVLVGNALGAASWAYAQFALPRLWANVPPTATLPTRAGLIALSFILLAAPPVLTGALGAWLARRGQMWVGLACGLWSLSLIQSVSPSFPIARGVWYAPAALVLLSSGVGGWMIDLRAQASALRGRVTADDGRP